jgi:hypothetical protein
MVALPARDREVEGQRDVAEREPSSQQHTTGVDSSRDDDLHPADLEVLVGVRRDVEEVLELRADQAHEDARTCEQDTCCGTDSVRRAHRHGDVSMQQVVEVVRVLGQCLRGTIRIGARRVFAERDEVRAGVDATELRVVGERRRAREGVVDVVVAARQTAEVGGNRKPMEGHQNLTVQSTSRLKALVFEMVSNVS